jgi:hypothetical protein
VGCGGDNSEEDTDGDESEEEKDEDGEEVNGGE